MLFTVVSLLLLVIFTDNSIEMMFRKWGITLSLLATTAIHALAQTDFCTALKGLVDDASHKFAKSRGATTVANAQVVKWECQTKLPGVISARIVSSMGVFYEGAMYQTASKDSMMMVYNQNIKALNSCLGQAYKHTEVAKYDKGAEDFKKQVYIRTDDDADMPPPHLALDVDYNKEDGKYTLLLFVLEH